MKVEYIDKPGYLLVKADISWNFQNAKQLIDETKIEAEKRGVHRILYKVHTWLLPESELTRFMTGEYLAKVLHPPFKVAAFANPIYIKKFMENTAVNRGAIFQVFSDEQSAIQWLLK